MELQKKVEKDDLLTRMRIREVLLFGLIALSAILAQLPHEFLEEHGINRNYLLGVLACGIIIGLFFYLRFFFFLAVVLLILGANLDQQISEYINISKVPLVLALVAMVGISLINYVVKLMPTGLEEKPYPQREYLEQMLAAAAGAGAAAGVTARANVGPSPPHKTPPMPFGVPPRTALSRLRRSPPACRGGHGSQSIRTPEAVTRRCRP